MSIKINMPTLSIFDLQPEVNYWVNLKARHTNGKDADQMDERKKERNTLYKKTGVCKLREKKLKRLLTFILLFR